MHAVASCLLLFSFVASGATPEPKEEMVRLRDGVRLATDVYLPKAQPAPYPVLVFRTPYEKRDDFARMRKTMEAALARGYALVVQDIRGVYRSEGKLKQYEQEGPDGYDTIEWAAKQPWSNGRVGMFGVSYRGAVQWLAATQLPPSLRAIVPGETFSRPNHFLYYGGVFDVGWARWTWDVFAPEARRRAGLAGPKNADEATRVGNQLGEAAFAGFLPLAANPHLVAVADDYFAWLAREPFDTEAWRWGELARFYPAIAKSPVAAFHFSSWHDDAYGPWGAVDGFRGLVAGGRKPSPTANRLWLGPWIHSAYHAEEAKAGERAFASVAAIDFSATVLDFLDVSLRGEDHGLSAQAPVRVFLMGEDRWIDSPTWPLPGTKTKTLFLTAEKTLGAKAPKAGTLSFVSDPAKPVRDRWGTSTGAFDVQELSQRSDVLTFETEPLTEDIRVVGTMETRVFVAADAPDFDLYARVLDVFPDGRAFTLTSPGNEVVRASYRNEKPRRELLRPGQVVELRLAKALTGNSFRKGHRIRLLLHASWFPTFARNPQTGESEKTSAALRSAVLTVHCGGARRSQLRLPAVP